MAVAVSTALHAALLFAITSSPSGWDTGRLPSGPFERAEFEVRLSRQDPEDAAAVALPGARPGRVLPGAASFDMPAAARSLPAAREPAQGIALVPPPKYYRATELDVRPQIKTRVMLAYPAHLQDVSGKVVIQVFIDESGKVDDVVVSRAEPAGIFEESAVTALRLARFTPGIKDRKAVKSRIVLEVTYGDAGQPDTAPGTR
jgi:TonB family protein